MEVTPCNRLHGYQYHRIWENAVRRFLTIALLVAVSLTACGPATPPPTPMPTDTPAPPTSTPLPSPTAISTSVPNVLYVNPGMKLGPISPYVYGSNFGPWTAIPIGMIDYALKSDVTALRFPAGSWGDQNDVTTLQIDLFMGIAKRIGAMPTFSVRLLNGTPEKAAQLVHYVNIEKGYGVVYWSIGNEPNLYASIPGMKYDTVRFNKEWRAIAEAMKAVDPSIKLIGPELSQFTADPASNPKDASGRDWMTEFLKANGDLVDVVTYHRYPFPKQMTGPSATINDLRQDPPEWPATVRYLRGLIRQTVGHDLPVAVTEAGSHYTGAIGGEATPDSFYNAIWWADVLGRLINENVFMVNQWLLTTASGQQDGLGLIASGKVRPTYYVYQMYKNFGTQHIYASSGIQDVSIYAAQNDSGQLTLMVINLSDQEQHAPLKIQGLTPTSADTWLFDASHNAEDLGQQSIPADGQLVLPPQSITLYIIQ